MESIINILSLFDGISGAKVALNRLGINTKFCYFASEIDKYAIKISRKNHPDIFQLGNINDIRVIDLPQIDLLIGGSPCQGFSFAGKQLNFKDKRSKLFFEYVRLLKECTPKYFLLENVRMKKEYQDVISDLLGVKPIIINSALVSAQNRVRLYWTNIKVVDQPQDKGELLKDIIVDGVVDREKAHCIDANYYKGVTPEYYFSKSRRQIVFKDKSHRKLTPLECERLQTYPDNYTEGVSNTQRYKMLGNSFTVDVTRYILSYMC